MKFGSITALALVLAASGTVVAMEAPAAAKEKKADTGKGPNYDLSKPVRDAVGAAQTALAAGDTATAGTKLTEAQAAAKTDDDRFVTASVLYELSKKTGDKAQQAQGLEGMLAGNRLPADQRNIILVSLGQTALQTNNLPKAEQYLSQALQNAPDDNDAYALLAETKVKEGKPAEAGAVFQQAMARAQARGTKLPADFYGRAVSVALNAKLPDQTEALTQAWLVAYPTKDNWRDSLVTWRDLHKPDADLSLDFMRLQRTVGALKGQGDYLEYADAVYLRYPGEAKSVIDEGVKAGFISLAANQGARELNGAVAGKVAGDKASLAASAAAAKGAKGTAKSALNTADGYSSYGDYANAIPLYRLALEKGGLDANLVNTRLGAALARSGDKAGAKAAFASVTGPRAALAKYWTIWIDGPQTIS